MRVLLLSLLLVTPVWANEAVYGKKAYGYDEATWRTICPAYPFTEAELKQPEFAKPLMREGLLQEGVLQASPERIGLVCEKLGLVPGGVDGE